MREKFRDWNLRGSMSVKYKSADGGEQVWTANPAQLLFRIQLLIQSYQEQDITLTARQLYYQLVASDVIPNAEATYKRICKFLTDARYAGEIDWDAIEDRGRVPSKPSEWGNVGELMKSATQAYRLPRWSDQEEYVELYCEKQAMESVLAPVARKYHIYFGCNKGYSSASTMYELAQRIKEQLIWDGDDEPKKKAKILYLGDHDPSGVDMIRDIRTRIEEFLEMGEEYVEGEFEVIPLALNMEQIRQYNPPPNPAKITDPRAKDYIRKYGNQSWELDALKPEVLMRIAEEGIQRFLDIDKYNAWIKLEQEQKKALIEFGEKLSKGGA